MTHHEGNMQNEYNMLYTDSYAVHRFKKQLQKVNLIANITSIANAIATVTADHIFGRHT